LEPDVDYGSGGEDSDGDAGEFNAPDLDELPTEGESLGGKGIYLRRMPFVRGIFFFFANANRGGSFSVKLQDIHMYVHVYIGVGGSAVAGEEEDLWRVLDPHDGSAYAVRPLKKGVFLCMCMCTLSLFTHTHTHTRAHTHRSHGAASIYAIKVFAGCHVDRPVGQADALAQSTFAAGVFRSLSPGAQYIYIYMYMQPALTLPSVL